MSSYVAPYTNDFGRVYEHARITSYLVDQLESSRFPAAEILDLAFFPDILKDAVDAFTQGCDLPVVKARHAQVWLNETSYLEIPCPFRPDTNEWRTFYDQLGSNQSALLVLPQGEHLSNFWTEFNAVN
jgi:hypothetical protein